MNNFHKVSTFVLLNIESQTMNSKSRATIDSLRLRTLPLSMAGVLLGIFLAATRFKVSFPVSILIIITTICLQILSNLSNELGDVLNGTDGENRQGPRYGLDSGTLTTSEMKILISVFAVLCALSGIAMVWVSFGTLFSAKSLFTLVLGAAAIVSAMRYTLGKNPYGYRGLGDIFVFIFFGLVSVLGGCFVAARMIPDALFALPAAAIGCFSVGVLNTNNIRDMKTDADNRVTVAIRLGLRNARIYQTVLICLGWIMLIAFTAIYRLDPRHFLFLSILPLHIIHLKGIWTRTDRALDPMLPLLVISTFILSILLGASFLIF